MSSTNPYEVTAEFEAAAEEPGSDVVSPRRLVTTWILVFLINLPVPVMFGSSVVASAGGYAGMALGCLLWCGLGLILCFGRHARHIQATIRGGWLVALTQFYPVLHMLIGLLAGVLVGAVFDAGSSGRGPMNLTSNTVTWDMLISTSMTLVTGAILILEALIIGTVITLIMRVLRETR